MEVVDGAWRLLMQVWKFANSNFFTSFIGALAGAWGGAYAAQRIADRKAERSRLVDEVKNANAGIEVAGSICNVVAMIAGQHIRPMKKAYDEEKAAILAHAMGLRSGRIAKGSPFPRPQVDQGSLPELRVQTERLGNIVLDKLGTSGRTRGLVTSTVQTMGLLNEIIRNRNALCLEMRSMSEEERAIRLFGLPWDGGVDQTYSDYMDGLAQYSRDVIYFTAHTCLALRRHGKRMEARLKRKFRGPFPRVDHVELDDLRERGLLAERTEYEAWERGYLELVGRTEGREWAKRWIAVRRLGRRALRKPWKWTKAA